MLPSEHLIAFVVIAFVLIVVPGPSVLFVVTRSLTLGRRAGIATAVGNAAGVYAQVVLVAIAVLCDAVWALAAGAARDWLVRSPSRLAAIGGAGGITMIGLGAGLAVAGRKD